jgi:hypothetical protein
MSDFYDYDGRACPQHHGRVRNESIRGVTNGGIDRLSAARAFELSATLV